LVQKAAEIVQEVKSLGNNLLSAMEKEDGESLAILRAKHERVVMELVEHVKYGQLQEAIKSREGLLQTLALAVQRYTYYERQMGKLAEARDLQDAVQAIHLGGQAISLLPQFGIKFHFWGLGGDANYGGFNLGKIAQFAANVAAAFAERKTYEAGKAAKIGSYA